MIRNSTVLNYHEVMENFKPDSYKINAGFWTAVL